MHRLYTFGNFYLSSIQQGIQAAHAAVEMAAKYGFDGISEEQRVFDQWANQDKTMICKNGGAEAELRDIKTFLNSNMTTLPWSFFHEEGAALNDALTCVAVVVPERLWDAGVMFYASRKYKATSDEFSGDVFITNADNDELLAEFTHFEWELIALIKNSPNAR